MMYRRIVKSDQNVQDMQADLSLLVGGGVAHI